MRSRPTTTRRHDRAFLSVGSSVKTLALAAVVFHLISGAARLPREDFARPVTELREEVTGRGAVDHGGRRLGRDDKDTTGSGFAPRRPGGASAVGRGWRSAAGAERERRGGSAAVAIAASVVIANGRSPRAGRRRCRDRSRRGWRSPSIRHLHHPDLCRRLATWTDLWACTATCAICHARTWTAIRWTWTAIARSDGPACWSPSMKVQNTAESPQLASMAALEPICAW